MKNRGKTYDRGYVDAADKLRVFIESRSKVMYAVNFELLQANLALLTVKPLPYAFFGFFYL